MAVVYYFKPITAKAPQVLVAAEHQQVELDIGCEGCPTASGVSTASCQNSATWESERSVPETGGFEAMFADDDADDEAESDDDFECDTCLMRYPPPAAMDDRCFDEDPEEEEEPICGADDAAMPDTDDELYFMVSPVYPSPGLCVAEERSTVGEESWPDTDDEAMQSMYSPPASPVLASPAGRALWHVLKDDDTAPANAAASRAIVSKTTPGACNQGDAPRRRRGNKQTNQEGSRGWRCLPSEVKRLLRSHGVDCEEWRHFQQQQSETPLTLMAAVRAIIATRAGEQTSDATSSRVVSCRAARKGLAQVL
eukprot:CAMPEP_0170234836 /NCGR_PEP_ID=MMETSP0116_2-20130129/17162_1 /TAXON_ID=400756 /ORGANISM="Durinskia baltica, Strain CSIRO CS-38" /LENGTH=309 /DNA_ID=CAMNT_0010485627 /DNA_START=62 /DNA_END=991 /DNA_ORIENTATION=+